MTWYEIIYFIIALIVMLFGLAGTVLPIIPGIPIIFTAFVIYAILTDFASISGQTVIVFAILTAASVLLDWLAGSLGVRKMGGSTAGMIGALVGTVVGLFIPGAGLFIFILCAFIGAVVFEMIAGRESRAAFRAGLGSLIGFLAGTVVKLAIAIIMIVYFVWVVLF
ncbi:MAG: DUF456 family protein [Candidatus Zixiibacteriota bacterium]